MLIELPGDCLSLDLYSLYDCDILSASEADESNQKSKTLATLKLSHVFKLSHSLTSHIRNGTDYRKVAVSLLLATLATLRMISDWLFYYFKLLIRLIFSTTLLLRAVLPYYIIANS